MAYLRKVSRRRLSVSKTEKQLETVYVQSHSRISSLCVCARVPFVL